MARRREGEREAIQPRRRPARARDLEVDPVEIVSQVFLVVPEGDRERTEGGAGEDSSLGKEWKRGE